MYQQDLSNSKKVNKIFKYNVCITSNRMVKFIEFCYCRYDSTKKSKLPIIISANDGEIEKICISRGYCKCFINAYVSNLQIISSEKLKFKYVNVVYANAFNCVTLFPGQTLPLPPEPAIINTVISYAFTLPGETSIIGIGPSIAAPLKTQTLTDPITLFLLTSPTSFESSSVFIFNLGDSIIYICKLSTALIE